MLTDRSSRLNRTSSRLNERPSITDAQRQLLPYVEEAKQEKRQELDFMQPVKWIFDLLSRGQYLTSNVAEEIIKSVRDKEPLGIAAKDALTGALEGITGKRKGDWETTLFGGQDTGEEADFSGLFPESGIPNWAKKVIGLAANVALDPTTYIGFGPSKGAVAGARKYAGEATELAVRKFKDLGALAEVAGRGVDSAKIQEMIVKGGKDAENAFELLSKVGKGDVARELDKVYRNAYKTALRTPQEALQTGMKGEIGDLIAREGGIGTKSNTVDILTNLAERVTRGYGGKTGERAWSFMGHEFAKSVRNPVAIQGWDKLTKALENSPVGSKLQDAWWSVNNTGIIGDIRQKLGIRNPYQKYLNAKQRTIASEATVAETQYSNAIKEVFKKYDPKVQEDGIRVIQLAEEFGKGLDPTWTAEDLLSKPDLLADLWNQKYPEFNINFNREFQDEAVTSPIKKTAERKVTEGYNSKLSEAVKGIQNVDQVKSFLRDHFKITQSYMASTKKAVASGVLDNASEMFAYFPTIPKNYEGMETGAKAIGTASPKFNKPRSFTSARSFEQQKETIKWMYGLDEASADYLVRSKGYGAISTNYGEAMATRALAQARLEKHVNIVENFKMLGIDVSEAEGLLGERLARPGMGLEQLGLVKVNGRAFDGLYFDKEVADILNRAVPSTKGAGLNVISEKWNAFTNWWKGFVTMTTGFHVRNWTSNNFTGFMNFGPEWFDPRNSADSIVSTIYCIARDNPTELLKKAGISEGFYKRQLNKRIGDYTLADLSEYAYKTGVFSTATQGFDPKDMLKKHGPNLNPLSQNFAGMEISRKIGNVVENQPRLQSFLMNFRQTMGESVGDITVEGGQKFTQHEAALEYAKLEAKKQFLDYGNLTEFERNVLKKVIPFYSWIRGNLANQVAMIVASPNMYSLLPKGEQALTSDTGIDPDLVPQWMRDIGMIPVQNMGGGKAMMFNPNLPYQDINKIPVQFGENGGFKVEPRQVLDDLISSAHPMIKTIIQQIPEKGYDVFYKRDLSYAAKAPFVLRYFTKVPGMLGVMDGIARTIGIKDGIKAQIDDQGVMRIDGRMAKIMEDNLPILRAMERIMLVGNEVIPGFEQAVEQATGSKDDYEGLERFFQLMSYWGGIKFKVADLNAEKERLGKELMDKAQAKKTQEEKYTPAAQRRKLKYAETTNRRIRNLGLGGGL